MAIGLILPVRLLPDVKGNEVRLFEFFLMYFPQSIEPLYKFFVGHILDQFGSFNNFQRLLIVLQFLIVVKIFEIVFRMS